MQFSVEILKNKNYKRKKKCGGMWHRNYLYLIFYANV